MELTHIANKIFVNNFPMKLSEGPCLTFTSPLFLGIDQEANLKKLGVGEPGVSVIRKIISTPGVKSLYIIYPNHLVIETEENLESIGTAIKALAMSL